MTLPTYILAMPTLATIASICKQLVYRLAYTNANAPCSAEGDRVISMMGELLASTGLQTWETWWLDEDLGRWKI